MKKIIFSAFFALSVCSSYGQDGFTYLQFKGGFVRKEAMTISLGFDFSKKYYSAYEVTATYLKSFDKKVSYETIFNETDSTYTKRELNHAYENLLLGIQYKPLVFRQKNTAIKFRLGGYIGTDFDNFIASPNLGFEFIQSLTRRVDLTISNNNGYFFWASKPTRWRNTAELGIRVAL